MTLWNHGTIFLAQYLPIMESLSYNTKTRSAVSVLEILCEKIPDGNAFWSQGGKEIHACLLLSREVLHVLGFAWHA